VIVVDTNVLAYALVHGEHTGTARAVFARDPDWAAPLLVRSELRSVLVAQVRRGVLALSEAVAVLVGVEVALQEREFEVESEGVLALALTSGCSSYDCEFVALARALGVPLVTSDRQVLAAFPDRALSPEVFIEAGSR